MSAVGAQAAALLHAARWGYAQHGAAHFLRAIAQTLQASSPGAANADRAALHIGAIAFIHRFGPSLNEHVHLHVCVVDGVFEEVAGEGDGDADDQARAQVRAPGVIFHPATGVYADAVGQAQASLRKRILRAFVGRGLLAGFEAKEMLGYKVGPDLFNFRRAPIAKRVG